MRVLLIELCARNYLVTRSGRAELVSDKPLLDQMTAGLKTNNRFSTLVTQIVTSPQFRYRRVENDKALASN